MEARLARGISSIGYASDRVHCYMEIVCLKALPKLGTDPVSFAVLCEHFAAFAVDQINRKVR
jgi:hypothetical protein